MQNIDQATVDGFGKEWSAFDQSALSPQEAEQMFWRYFRIFDFTELGEGFDLGCGSGRWARFVAPRAKRLHCIDPSDAIEVAKRNLGDHKNVTFHRASADSIPLADGSQNFGYCLGVLHHIPDPDSALTQCVRKLKPGGQFLVYMYYRFDNRPSWFRALWKMSDAGRRVICRLPFPARKSVAALIAAGVYWPLARFSKLVENIGRDPSSLPLSLYRSLSFYTMRTDALDRFGTKLEQRFTRQEIQSMMERSGLGQVRFSDHAPYWVAVGYRR